MREIPVWAHGVGFTVAQGRAFGLTDARLRSRRLERPFHGVRVWGTAGRVDGGLIDRCSDLAVAYANRSALFTHATAARLWGMPLPRSTREELHVLVPGRTAVRRPGVVGWVRHPFPEPDLVHGLPVTSPADTWAMLAAMSADRGGTVTRGWLVAIGDFLVSGRRVKGGREPALATRDDLAAAVERHGARRGAEALAWALGRVRSPVDSPPETFLRLGLCRARLSEPEVQPPVMTAAGLRHPDLGYLRERVLLEYLGDVHRTDRSTWRRDLTRVQLFEDAGYRVILAGADDVSPTGIGPLAERVRRALRGAHPP